VHVSPVDAATMFKQPPSTSTAAVCIEASLHAGLAIALTLAARTPGLSALAGAALTLTALQLRFLHHPASAPPFSALFTPPAGVRAAGTPADALGLAPAALLPAVLTGLVSPAASGPAVALGWYVLAFGSATPSWQRWWVVEAAALTVAAIGGWAGWGWGWGAAAWAAALGASVRALLAAWDGCFTLAEAACVAAAAGAVARRVVRTPLGAGAAASPPPAQLADTLATAALAEAVLLGAVVIPAAAAGRRWWGAAAAWPDGRPRSRGSPGGMPPRAWVATFYAALVALTAAPTAWLGVALGTRNPAAAVAAFLVMPPGHGAMLLYWVAVGGASAAAVAAARRVPGLLAPSAEGTPQRRARRVVARKTFHGLAVALFFPALVRTPDLLAVAAAVALALFLAVEAVRVAGVPPASTLTRAMDRLLDERDGGVVVTTHMTLLVGCVLPMWLRLPSQRAAVVGLAGVGVGDAVAAAVGVTYGRRTWLARSTRTVAGSIAGWAAAVGLAAAWVAACATDDPAPWAAELPRWAAALAWVLAAEAVTGQIDNLVLGAGGVAAAMLAGIGT